MRRDYTRETNADARSKSHKTRRLFNILIDLLVSPTPPAPPPRSTPPIPSPPSPRPRFATPASSPRTPPRRTRRVPPPPTSGGAAATHVTAPASPGLFSYPSKRSGAGPISSPRPQSHTRTVRSVLAETAIAPPPAPRTPGTNATPFTAASWPRISRTEHVTFPPDEPGSDDERRSARVGRRRGARTLRRVRIRWRRRGRSLRLRRRLRTWVCRRGRSRASAPRRPRGGARGGRRRERGGPRRFGRRAARRGRGGGAWRRFARRATPTTATIRRSSPPPGPRPSRSNRGRR